MPPTHTELQHYLNEGKTAAIIGGELLRRYWGKLESIREKGFAWDLVTEADTASEKGILDHLHKKFPSHQTLSEEAGHQGDKESPFQWVIDPLDGTTNYTHQYPMIAVSIGLWFQGDPVAAIVYNPIINEMFLATKGGGATLNGNLIKVSTTSVLSKSLLATGFAYDRLETTDTNYTEFCYLTNVSQGVRRLGAAAIDLAYVAAGRLDGFWERGLKPWDMAAGALLVTEAGGRISDYEMKPVDFSKGRILATNGVIHDALNEALKAAKKK
jgi:myo-inositol-1(or 4)-monophosphatase